MFSNPRVMLFPNFLDYDKWSAVNEYCKNNGPLFPSIKEEESPLCWVEKTHSKDSDLKFIKSFYTDEIEPNKRKKHGEYYKNNIEYYIKDENTKEALTAVLDSVHLYIESIENKKVIRESGPWITRLIEGGTMPLHCDGLFMANHGSTSEYSVVYYINDDYEGGEFCMPRMGLKFKPMANSLILFTHSDHEDMVHEVTLVTSGIRYVSQSWYASMV
jgi:hypothetical protein